MTWRIASAACVLVLVVVAQPASAQVDLSGTWSPRYEEDFSERVPGPELGDYTGLPLTEYIYRGPTNIAVWEERDLNTRELIAIKHRISTFDQERTIYMDGGVSDKPGSSFSPSSWMAAKSDGAGSGAMAGAGAAPTGGSD